MPDLETRTLSGLTIEIDRGACIATQNCIHVAPEVFELASDQIVMFVPDAEDIAQERLIEACAVCPVDALMAFEAGRQIVPR